MASAVAAIESWIASGARQYVCVTGVHGVMESQRDAELRGIHNRAGLVTPDGMPLVFLCRWLGQPQTKRVYGPDLMLAVCERSDEAGWRHYFYGGGPGVAEVLQQRLSRRFPRLIVCGVHSPPFGELSLEEDEAIVERIRAARPDVVWVGLSTPKQERWMAAHVDRLAVPVLLGVGAAFDFNSGLKKQAPPWMQRASLEWLHRLSTEPRRLWKRYLLNNPAFVFLVARQLLRQRDRAPEA